MFRRFSEPTTYFLVNDVFLSKYITFGSGFEVKMYEFYESVGDCIEDTTSRIECVIIFIIKCHAHKSGVAMFDVTELSGVIW